MESCEGDPLCLWGRVANVRWYSCLVVSVFGRKVCLADDKINLGGISIALKSGEQ